MGRHRAAVCLVVSLLAAGTLGAAPQGATALRLRGVVLTGAGAPVQGALVRTDAVAGALGDQFTGQRQFTVTTDRRGQWNLLGLTAGVWLFEVTARGHLPHVVAMPIQMTRSALLPTISWRLTVELQPETSAGPLAGDLARVVDLIEQKRQSEATAALERIQLEDATPETLCAAGDISLLLRDYAGAFGLFNRAVEARPDWYRPHLGVASASILMLDYETAAKAYWEARSLAPRGDLEQAMSAAIEELGHITGYRWIRPPVPARHAISGGRTGTRSPTRRSA